VTPTISQRVKFSAPAETPFEMYMDSQKHAASTGAPAKLSRKVGGAWSAYGGSFGGKNLLIVPDKHVARIFEGKKEKIAVQF
jgi:hypothetical protein